MPKLVSPRPSYGNIMGGGSHNFEIINKEIGLVTYHENELIETMIKKNCPEMLIK